MALILVSHDLAVIEEVCDNVMVMYAGASVEAGPVAALSKAPRHPYTQGRCASHASTGRCRGRTWRRSPVMRRRLARGRRDAAFGRAVRWPMMTAGAIRSRR